MKIISILAVVMIFEFAYFRLINLSILKNLVDNFDFRSGGSRCCKRRMGQAMTANYEVSRTQFVRWALQSYATAAQYNTPFDDCSTQTSLVQSVSIAMYRKQNKKGFFAYREGLKK